MPDNAAAEVLVVGAGPVGMLTALLLTQQGVRTRIIDQESRTATRSYACALHPASLGILQRARILDDVLDLGRSVGTVGLYEGPARRAQAELSDLPGPYPFAVVLAQFLLEELLEEKLRAAGVQVEWHRQLREIQRGASGVDALIQKVAPTGRGDNLPELETAVGDCFQIRADFVVGADGHNSLLRQQLGIGSVRAGPPLLFDVYEIATVEPVDHEMKLVLTASGINVLWPLTENKCRWSFQINPPQADADFPQKDRAPLNTIQPPKDWESLVTLRRFLAERAPWFQHDIKDILWIAHVQFEPRLVLRLGEGRCWLAGDAAHQASPAGMQSMNLGLREAEDLAGKIKSILRDHADLDLLQDYDRLHRAEWKRLLGLKEPAEPPGGLSPWARQHFLTLLGNLPASGDDLDHLLEKL
jgi:NADPH-dependent dioxygenase